jgi:NAD(P)-dependent dehydrogenase (short-subunit alcohol dehydrogenase family)
LTGRNPERVAAAAADLAGSGAQVEGRVLDVRDAAAIERLAAECGGPAPVVVPQLAGDVHDIDGLVAVHSHLFGPGVS